MDQLSTKTSPVRVGIYVRSSVVDGKTQRIPQDAQLGRCVRWCDETYGTDGYTMSLFADEGLPGSLPWEPRDTGQHRAQLNNLVASVGERQLDVVVVSTLDRLSRSVQLSQKLIEEVLKPHGVRLVEAAGGTEVTVAPHVSGFLGRTG